MYIYIILYHNISVMLRVLQHSHTDKDNKEGSRPWPLDLSSATLPPRRTRCPSSPPIVCNIVNIIQSPSLPHLPTSLPPTCALPTLLDHVNISPCSLVPLACWQSLVWWSSSGHSGLELSGHDWQAMIWTLNSSASLPRCYQCSVGFRFISVDQKFLRSISVNEQELLCLHSFHVGKRDILWVVRSQRLFSHPGDVCCKREKTVMVWVKCNIPIYT